MPLEDSIKVKFCMSGSGNYTEDETVRCEKLPFELFIGVEKGKISVFCEDAAFEASEGECAYIPYDEAYSCTVAGGSAVSYAAITADVYSNLRVFSLYGMPRLYKEDEGKKLCSLCTEIAGIEAKKEFTSSRLENAVRLKAAVCTLASAALEKALPLSGRLDIMLKYEKLSPVLDFIHRNLDGEIRNAQLSELLSMTPDSFYRVFRSLMGAPPKEFIISERLRKARSRLVLTDMAIGAISSEAGYDNQLYFSSLFRKKYGICPTEYRKATLKII